MKYDLTLKKIKNTDFCSLYDNFIVGNMLNQKQYEILLAIAICFINADDINVQQLGYRIIVEYCNQTKDYIPLYEIAINKGLYPISKYIEQHIIDDSKRNFFTEFNDAFMECYVFSEGYRSEQQNSLVHFFEDKKGETVSVVAPTSYGKSELILSTVKEYAGRNVCILTSTKALLMQTKKRVQKISKMLFSKIIVHPEMYNPNDSSCLAILTQERLLRMFKKDPMLSFDCIIVDEAHEMLEDGDRSLTLANDIIIAQKRNSNVTFKFLTPFISDSTNLKARYTTYDIETFKVSEYIKTEKYYLYNIRDNVGLKLYDQFFNKYITVPTDRKIYLDEEVVKFYSTNKNIVYLNKPTDIEKFALALASLLPDVESQAIQTACDNISAFLQPEYNLVTCLRKGVIYHHGSVPDAIRIYIENLYRTEVAIKFVVTSSTLLSGVNLPAERLFVLDNRRGKSNLSHDSFKNLVGRVCRFNEIFNNETGGLHRLEPQIYIVFGKYFPQNANCENFLRNVARVEQSFEDDVSNVLLSEAMITEDNKEKLRQASEFIENYENGVVENYQERYTITESGKICIMNGITDFDVFEHEITIQKQVDKYYSENLKISDSDKLLEIINELFIKCVLKNGFECIKRLEKSDVRNFYSMMLEWKVRNKSYAEMINLFVGKWRKLYIEDNNVEVYVGKWGDIKRKGDVVARYTYLRDKDPIKVVNLAIVRIKEEQDFIDNSLIKYVEVLNDLGLIEDEFYFKIKYGTVDERVICLVKNGLSLSSAVLLVEKYYDYLDIDIISSTVAYDERLEEKMEKAKENQIQIYEIKNCI